VVLGFDDAPATAREMTLAAFGDVADRDRG